MAVPLSHFRGGTLKVGSVAGPAWGGSEATIIQHGHKLGNTGDDMQHPPNCVDGLTPKTNKMAH